MKKIINSMALLSLLAYMPETSCMQVRIKMNSSECIKNVLRVGGGILVAGIAYRALFADMTPEEKIEKAEKIADNLSMNYLAYWRREEYIRDFAFSSGYGDYSLLTLCSTLERDIAEALYARDLVKDSTDAYSNLVKRTIRGKDDLKAFSQSPSVRGYNLDKQLKESIKNLSRALCIIKLTHAYDCQKKRAIDKDEWDQVRRISDAQLRDILSRWN